LEEVFEHTTDLAGGTVSYALADGEVAEVHASNAALTPGRVHRDARRAPKAEQPLAEQRGCRKQDHNEGPARGGHRRDHPAVARGVGQQQAQRRVSARGTLMETARDVR